MMPKANKKIIIAASAGGHLTEALIIFEDIIKKAPDNICFLTDDSPRTQALKYKKVLFPVFEFNPLDYLKNIIKIGLVYKKFKPDFILTTGAQIGMVAIWVAKVFKIKTIFIETITRKNRPTLSARAVLPFVDVMLVQNKELLTILGPKAQYMGGIL